jgi:HAD superfamily 5'-nucleotidase-like hydrolase
MKKRNKLEKWQKVFVNRSLNMGNIRAIGFDMDHTLAMYNRENFEALAFRATLRKFIDAGYPAELETLQFKPEFLIRGLLVDMDRGNILKVDGHKYVKIAFHGHTRLDKESRHKLYNSESFKAYEFLSMDSFFALSEVQLFAEIVDYMNHNPGKIQKSFREVYADLRQFIDNSHADGSIKNEVLRNPERFFIPDKHLATALIRTMDAGKHLFLLTNSNYAYTDAVMNFILGHASSDFPDWRQYFRYVIVGAGKPGFFTGTQPFYEVVTQSNLLTAATGPLEPGKIYQGGNAQLLQKQTGFRGDEILYVGDHIYGDIIRSKGSVNWRTLLVVEELERELLKIEELRLALQIIHEKIAGREDCDEELQILRSKIASNARQAKIATDRGDNRRARHLLAENEKLLEKAHEKQALLVEIDELIKQAIAERDANIHPVWGGLMKVGLERSRFANQVESYACLYTSRVSNLRFYSPFKRFTSYHDILPHEV